MTKAIEELAKLLEESGAEMIFRHSDIHTAFKDLESELTASRQRIAEQDDEISACKERPGGCGYWREAARLRAAEKAELETQLTESRERENNLRSALEEIANNQDPDSHWAFDVAKSALRALPKEKP